ncbi:MAG: hypothetical protein ACXWPM_00115 [Bdellovibrionota bacterium]
MLKTLLLLPALILTLACTDRINTATLNPGGKNKAALKAQTKLLVTAPGQPLVTNTFTLGPAHDSAEILLTYTAPMDGTLTIEDPQLAAACPTPAPALSFEWSVLAADSSEKAHIKVDAGEAFPVKNGVFYILHQILTGTTNCDQVQANFAVQLSPNT